MGYDKGGDYFCLVYGSHYCLSPYGSCLVLGGASHVVGPGSSILVAGDFAFAVLAVMAPYNPVSMGPTITQWIQG
jgi:hypothetical protein